MKPYNIKKYIVLAIIILLFSSCSSDNSAELAIPKWLQGDWEETYAGSSFVVSCSNDNILTYFDGYLELDLKEAFATTEGVEIDRQIYSDTSYQLYFYTLSGYMSISFLYLPDTDTVIFTEPFSSVHNTHRLKRI